MAKFFPGSLGWVVVSALNAPTAAHGAKRIVRFHPPTDVLETDEQLMIMVELPGLEREDITLGSTGTN